MKNSFIQNRGKFLIKRDWAEDLELPGGWDIPCKIAKHRIYAYWSHPELIPCDDMGIRIPVGFSSFREKYRESRDCRKIFCFGGSTTMGFFCKYEESFPHYLESLLKNTAVFNFGLGSFDLTASMHLLLDLLRLAFIPDLAIFLDGINEKQAWFQSLSGCQDYEETSHQYGYFRTFVSGAPVQMALGVRKKQSLISKIRRIIKRSKEFKKNQEAQQDPLRFVSQQSEYYLKTKRTIQKLASAWNIKVRFFLQPILWDVWKEGTDARHTYIKILYKNILKESADILDLSNKTNLKPGDFIDWQHLNPLGNKVLAESIFEEIKE